jgi:hypothetical protein
VPPSKPKLTDEQRHERFKDMAREIDASEDAEDFDRAFKKVVPPSVHPSHHTEKPASS